MATAEMTKNRTKAKAKARNPTGAKAGGMTGARSGTTTGAAIGAAAAAEALTPGERATALYKDLWGLLEESEAFDAKHDKAVATREKLRRYCRKFMGVT